jgi:hypothetical protein
MEPTNTDLEKGNSHSEAENQHDYTIEIKCGYGQCRHCSCGSFSGSGMTCQCGHDFYDHW